MERYIGTYQTFQTVSRDEAANLLGPNNLVGDLYDIECTIDEGMQRAWLVNQFGKRVGYFEASYSRRLSILKAQGMTIKALLSFIAATNRADQADDKQGGAHYWGEAAVIAFDPTFEAPMKVFLEGLGKEMAGGRRLRIDLDQREVDRIIETNGTWLSKETVPLPRQGKNTVIMKSQRSFTDRMVAEGRKGNKGCYVVSWAFIIAVVALVIFGLKSCGVF